MNRPHSTNDPTVQDLDTAGTFLERVPFDLPENKTGSILRLAREELDVNQSWLTGGNSVEEEVLRAFEANEHPLTKSIWKSYIDAVSSRHGISIAKASGLFQGLVKEIIYHEDHER